MNISSYIFEAYLHCPTKCWLMSRGEVGKNNVYTVWMREKDQAYRANGIKRLSDGLQAGEFIAAPPTNLNLKTASWRLVSDVTASCEELVSCIHAVERTPSEERGKPAQFVPIRFVANNKLAKFDKLLIAFDSHILAETLKHEITHGKIIQGDGFSTLKVKTSVLVGEVRKIVGNISSLILADAPPDLVLNRHCPECSYQSRCRNKAIEKDDLSLLGGMTDKERSKLNSKGIFTVTQLSYTFRPRRRPKRVRDKREKYHHSLKALAIREKKIHIVGSPELKIEGTPVYLDVEGLPDRDFYYLIGVRIRQGDSAVQHSLWADRPEDEERIWKEFVGLLATIVNPVLIHYGSYETTFIKTMCNRYGAPCNPTQTSEVFKTSEVSPEINVTLIAEANKQSKAEKTFSSAINLLSVIYGHVYFPVASNGLKEIAGYCGFQWSEMLASGLQSIVWRKNWEVSKEMTAQEKLIRYNAEDCEALESAVNAILQIILEERASPEASGFTNVINVDLLKPAGWPYIYGKKEYIFPEFSYVNDCARWDYQRSRIYIRSNPNLKQAIKVTKQKILPFNVIVGSIRPPKCPNCNHSKFRYSGGHTKNYIDLRFFTGGIKRWVSHYIIRRYKCKNCNANFNSTIPEKLKKHQRYGTQLQAYVIYNIIELHIPMLQLAKILEKHFGIPMLQPAIGLMKNRAATFYQDTFEKIRKTLLNSKVIHADETHLSIKGRDTYVWVFTSMEEVVYVWSETREADFAIDFLKDFKGVLVSDFYTAYDSIDCSQQRCLIHLIRDLNDDVLKEPFNEEIKGLVQDFAALLRPIIETVDRFGLKTYFLKKHKADVNLFFNALFAREYKTELAQKAQTRFKKNQNRLFSFLDYDNVPWNNNNAEHAVKAFRRGIGHIIEGRTSKKGIAGYLILLSICQTCVYRGVNFLDFLSSGEKDIDVFAASSRRRRVHTKTRSTTQRVQKPRPTIYQSECVIE